MLNVKIVDNQFSHAKYSTDNQESKYIVWDRTMVNSSDKIVFYTDNSLWLVNPNVKTKIAWLLESPEFTKNQHEWIKINHNRFDIVFTNNKEHLEISDKFKFVPTCGCWIFENDQKIYEKTKLLSMISSSKNSTNGHRIRHEVMNKFKNKMDLYGRQYKPIVNKLEGLKDYMFSIAIENTKKDYYFTEKLIDCFSTGTIPIYWGCPSIGNFFDEKGIITFDTVNDLENIINNLSYEQYESMIEGIKNNFEISKKYLISEDYIYENYLKNL